MNPIAEEIASYLGSASMTGEEFIRHKGVGHLDGGHSGRYPWGSGEDPYQREKTFLDRINKLRSEGWRETAENVKSEFGLSLEQYRMEKTIANNYQRAVKVAKAKELKEQGKTDTEIGKIMGVNESTVRGWWKESAENNMNLAKNTAELLKKEVEEKRMIDVGKDVERELNVPRTKLDTALYLLEKEGYHVYSNRIPQPTNKNQMTTQQVLCAKDIVAKDGQKVPKEMYDYDKIQTITDYISRDGGETYEKKFTYPASLDSKRLQIRYANDVGADGVKGIEKDGIVELRRGVADLSLGESRYSQVRILVDGTHYIKGVAVYSDNMPDGVDVVFNTNKTKEKCPNKTDVLKEIKNDPDNPFGSSIKDSTKGGQYWYDSKTGERISGSSDNPNKKLGLINKRADEGDWSEWKDTLPSQFLSKQSKDMAKKQLNIAKADKEAEFEEIKSLTNPTIKKYYLEKFASTCDSAAVDLKAAALPGQKYHVLVPINSIGDDKVYAPNYKDGTKLALIRYPHGGTFEIPILTVDNKNQTARKLLGTDVGDVVGITSKVAERLSGADFDGDAVMCIPTKDKQGKVNIISTDPLKDLVGFDSKSYQFTDTQVDSNGNKHYFRNGKEFKVMKNTNLEMGKISNLITDMTLQGAPPEQLARAVKHSMVVIDAEKHKLDYQQSFIDNNISQLKKDWQEKVDKNGNTKYGGATTIVSRSKGQADVLKRKGEARVNVQGKSYYDSSKPEGSLIYMTAPDNELYYAISNYDKKTGKKTVYPKKGSPITYDMTSKSDRDKYEPVMRKDESTGEVYFTNKDKTITYKSKARTIKSTNMGETTDAYTLVSTQRHPMELIYADYANSMKALANKARVEKINTPKLEYSPTAHKIYATEVSSLEAKLNNASKNSIKERQALRLAASELKKRQEADPNMKSGDITKLSQRLTSKYREKVNSQSRKERAIKITDKEWEAIQAGAITENKLKQILNNSDADVLREKAMPKDKIGLSVGQINRIKAMSASFTIAQIAEKMGISPSTVSKYLKGVK
jgi:DNA-binding CsgD family transcriptional regulator